MTKYPLPCQLYDMLSEEFGEIAMIQFGEEIAEFYKEVSETDRLFSFPVESLIDNSLEVRTIRLWLASGELEMVKFDGDDS